MDTVRSYLCHNWPCFGLAVGILGASVFVRKRFARKNVKPRICGVDYPKDIVIVHEYVQGDVVPSLGHFVMKLETYLRINKIPYQEVYSLEFGGPKKKVPWIEYNGVTMADSQLIMEFLNEQLSIDLNKTLDAEQRAMAWAIQKWLEEFIYHLNIYTRWCLLTDDFGNECASTLPKSALYMVKDIVYTMQWMVGTARHSKQEVFDMTVFNLRQFATLLGDKTFLMGGHEPTEVDCAAFGILCQIHWSTPNSCPGKQVLEGELHNVVSYLERMKEQYWPDWDDKITGGLDKV